MRFRELGDPFQGLPRIHWGVDSKKAPLNSFCEGLQADPEELWDTRMNPRKYFNGLHT